MTEVKASDRPRVALHEGKITDEGVAGLRAKIGLEQRLPPSFNTVAGSDAIRKFVDGIGDVNPLYRDKEYASKSIYGCLVAPPSFMYSVYPTLHQVGLPGVHGFHSGNDWEFLRPILVDDPVKPFCHITHVDEKVSEFSGRTAIVHFASRYVSNNVEVARAKAWTVRAERKAARTKGKYSAIELPHPWTEEELQKIEDEILKEQIRGAEVRYWDDVVVGEEMPRIVRGPLNVMDEVAYCVAGGFPTRIQAYPAAMPFYRKHPAWTHRGPSGALEPAFVVHFDVEAAKSAGLPYPYDIGTQRNTWLFSLLTNWAGDDGFVQRCYAEYRRFNYFSDVTYISGRVTEKFVGERGECAVVVETSAINQRGENTMPGKATILLPSRSGYHPLTTAGRLGR